MTAVEPLNANVLVRASNAPPNGDGQKPTKALLGHGNERGRREDLAVLVVDIAGYSMLMEGDEDDTAARLINLWSNLLEPGVNGHRGRIVNSTGDGFLASFRTARDAIRCTVMMQTRLLSIAAQFPPERRILFRMGLNFCGAIAEGPGLYGEGVNIAARMMSYAEAGDIVMTETFAAMVEDDLIGFQVCSMGDLPLKNISRPVRAISVRIASAGNLTVPKALGAVDPRPSVAVLPFRAQFSGEAQDFYADGLVEEITHALSGVKDLFVVSRGSALRFMENQHDLVAIGRELGVRYLLQGSIRRSGERVRVTTELIEAQSAHIIRSNRHDSTVDQLFELQAEIALAATNVIAPNIQEWELRRAMRKHPESLTAYDLVLQARQQLYRLDYASHSRARGLLQQAITLDPHYAPAYSFLAHWHIFHVGEGWSTDPAEDAAEAARVARAALDRDEYDALAMAVYGHVQSFLFHDYQAAMAHFDRAIEIGPNCAEAWSMSSFTCGYLDDGRSAVERARYGFRLSPLDRRTFYKEFSLAQAYYVNGEHEAAAAWARKARAQSPTAMYNDRVLVASLSALGQTDEAQEVAKGIMQRVPRLPPWHIPAAVPIQGGGAGRVDRKAAPGRPAGLTDP